jgi:hypothetical protein
LNGDGIQKKSKQFLEPYIRILRALIAIFIYVYVTMRDLSNLLLQTDEAQSESLSLPELFWHKHKLAHNFNFSFAAIDNNQSLNTTYTPLGLFKALHSTIEVSLLYANEFGLYWKGWKISRY